MTQDAAELYERAGMHEKAATIYIQAGQFGLAAPLMALITHNPTLQLEFAKAKESKRNRHCLGLSQSREGCTLQQLSLSKSLHSRSMQEHVRGV